MAVETGGSKQLVDNERVISLALAKLLFWSDGEQYPEVWTLTVPTLCIVEKMVFFFYTDVASGCSQVERNAVGASLFGCFVCMCHSSFQFVTWTATQEGQRVLGTVETRPFVRH